MFFFHFKSPSNPCACYLHKWNESVPCFLLQKLCENPYTLRCNKYSNCSDTSHSQTFSYTKSSTFPHKYSATRHSDNAHCVSMNNLSLNTLSRCCDPYENSAQCKIYSKMCSSLFTCFSNIRDTCNYRNCLKLFAGECKDLSLFL